MGILQAKMIREILVQCLDFHAKVSTDHGPVIHNLVVNHFGHVDRNCETKADRATCFAENGRVDTDDFPSQIHQGAPRITGIDRRVCLDEVFIVVNPNAVTTDRADDPGG